MDGLEPKEEKNTKLELRHLVNDLQKIVESYRRQNRIIDYLTKNLETPLEDKGKLGQIEKKTDGIEGALKQLVEEYEIIVDVDKVLERVNSVKRRENLGAYMKIFERMERHIKDEKDRNKALFAQLPRTINVAMTKAQTALFSYMIYLYRRCDIFNTDLDKLLGKG